MLEWCTFQCVRTEWYQVADLLWITTIYTIVNQKEICWCENFDKTFCHRSIPFSVIWKKNFTHQSFGTTAANIAQRLLAAQNLCDFMERSLPLANGGTTIVYIILCTKTYTRINIMIRQNRTKQWKNNSIQISFWTAHRH